MADEMNTLRDEGAVTGDELRQQTAHTAHEAGKHGHGLIDEVMNLGSEAGQKIGGAIENLTHHAEHAPTDLGHGVAHGEHNLARGIHATVAGGAHHVETGASGLFHHGQHVESAQPGPGLTADAVNLPQSGFDTGQPGTGLAQESGTGGEGGSVV